MWAALFPGQGSQHQGMGKFLYDEFHQARLCFEEASDTLKIDFKNLCFEGSEQDLALTENTQPCLLLVSTATYRVLQNEIGFAPKLAAGHSVGEYAAMVAAGTMTFADALRAVRARGQAMQTAVPVGEGGMTAVIGLDVAEVEKLCSWAEKECGDAPIEPANLNAPGQIVISGKKKVLDWLLKNFNADLFPGKRVKFIPLKVSAPFHCSLMKPAEEHMTKVLNEIQFARPVFPIVQNVSAQAESDPETLRNNLIRQVSYRVRWIECVETLVAMGARQSIEVGCGKVLAGLCKKISDSLTVHNVLSLEDLRSLAKREKEIHA